MNNDIVTAKNILLKNHYTCVLYFNETEYHSTLRGVRPLLDFLESEYDFNGFCAADKVVGAGAAHLYILLGVTSVWASIISDRAKKILEQNSISVFYETLVPCIINRAGDGVCPIETAVADITDSKQALITIKQTLETLAKSN